MLSSLLQGASFTIESINEFSSSMTSWLSWAWRDVHIWNNPSELSFQPKSPMTPIHSSIYLLALYIFREKTVLQCCTMKWEDTIVAEGKSGNFSNCQTKWFLTINIYCVCDLTRFVLQAFSLYTNYCILQFLSSSCTNSLHTERGTRDEHFSFLQVWLRQE